MDSTAHFSRDASISDALRIALAGMDRAESELGKLYAVRNGAETIERLGDDGSDAMSFLSDSAINVHGLDPDSVQKMLALGVEAASIPQVSMLPDIETLIPERRRAATQTEKRFPLIALDDIEIDDGAGWLIDGLLPAGPALHVVWGPPKSLKSFGLIDACLHVAAGVNYVGREVLAGAVVYITSEGVRGVKHRLIAMRQQLGIEGRNVPFYLIPAMPDLGTGTVDAKTLIASIEMVIPAGTTLRAIGIDTVRRATPGKDENAAKDMSQFVENCGVLANHFKCVVSGVHHSPRSSNDHGAGSNALDAAMDAGWRTDRSGDQATFTVALMKDGEQGTSWTFKLAPVQVGTTKAGSPIMSCGVSHLPDVLAKPAAQKPAMTKAAQTALRALKEAIDALGTPAPASNYIPAGIKVVTVEQWRQYAYARGISNSPEDRARQQAFKRAYEQLIGAERAKVWEGQVWPT
jgi:hypothetical protein